MISVPRVILLLDNSRAFGRGIMRGIAQYSRLHGPWVFYREPAFYISTGSLKTFLSRMRNWNADGIVARSSSNDKFLLELGLPTIMTEVNEPIAGIPNIIANDKNCGRIAAEHLIQRGFRHFAFCGFDDMLWSRVRGKSFENALKQAGFEIHTFNQPKAHTQRRWDKEQVVLSQWLMSLPKPIGLMACNDDRGQLVAETCKLTGLRVPDDVAIIGVDNDDLVCDLSDPPLSSIKLVSEKAGYDAAALLLKMMSGQKILKETIIAQPTHVVTRQSTDILAIEDPEVAAAVHFIFKNRKKNICVADVVNAVSISHRALHKHFQVILGRTIHEEIRKVRVGEIARLLAETHMSVAQIAYNLDYPGPEHLSRIFRKEKNMSLREYRKKHGPYV